MMNGNGKFGHLGVATDKPSRMPIILPGEIDPLVDEDGNEAYIDFLPWDSEPGRKFDQEQQRELVRKGFRQRSRAELRADAENIDQIKDQAERLAVLATGWHLVDLDRKPIDTPFSKANALELFTAPDAGLAAPPGLGLCGQRDKFYATLVEELCRLRRARIPARPIDPDQAAPNATT